MADVFLFQAGFLCADCGGKTRRQICAAGDKPAGMDVTDESTFDSDRFPKGPYPDGGGEADTPQHCDHCGTFLENPLTDDGRDYVREQIAAVFNEEDSHGKELDILNEWVQFYGIEMWVFMEYLPGCLPDSGPAVFFSADSALEYARERARDTANHIEPDINPDAAAAWESFASRLESADDIDSDYVKETAPDGYVLSIERETRLNG